MSTKRVQNIKLEKLCKYMYNGITINWSDVQMKYNMLKQTLIRGNVTDKTFTEYKEEIEKLPEDNRCQQLYTTAVQMKPQHYLQAIELIDLALPLSNGWVDDMRCHHNKGAIYENAENWFEAHYEYSKALDSIPDDAKTPAYIAGCSIHLMRVWLHCDGFEYSEDLQVYYDNATALGDTLFQSVTDMFYKRIAEVIIFTNCGDTQAAEKARKEAINILNPKFDGLLAKIKMRDYTEMVVGASKEAVEFLKL